MEESAAAGRPTSERRLPEPSPELLARCRQGDRDALGELFELTRDAVWAVALGLVRDEALAADVSQEVYVKLLGQIGRFGGRARFSTWLYRVTVNAAIDALRRRPRWVPLDQGAEGAKDAATGVPPRPHPHPGSVTAATQHRDAERAESARRVRQGVARLSPRLRAPIVLRFAGGLSYDEIAEVLGLSAGTVASRLHRALRRLGAILGPPEGTR